LDFQDDGFPDFFGDGAGFSRRKSDIAGRDADAALFEKLLALVFEQFRQRSLPWIGMDRYPSILKSI